MATVAPVVDGSVGEPADPVVVGASARRRDRVRLVWLTAGLALVSLATALWLSRHGVLVAGDGTTYVGVADNVLHGKGITQPFTAEYDQLTPASALATMGRSPMLLWPPLYPLLVAGGTFLGLDLAGSARLISVLSLVVVATTTGILGYRGGRRSIAAGVLAAALILLSTNTQFLVGTAYADLPATALAAPALLALPAFARRGGRLGFVVWLSVAAASSTKLIYVGLAFAAIAAVLLLRTRSSTGARTGSRGARWRDAALMATALAPVALWKLTSRSGIQTDAVPARFFADWPGRVSEIATVTRTFIVPWNGWPLLGGAAVAVLALLALVRRLRRPTSEPIDRDDPDAAAARLDARDTLTVLALAAAGELVVTMVALVASGRSMSLDGRVLLALQVPVVVLFAVAATSTIPRRWRELPRGTAPVLACAALVVAFVAAMVTPSVFFFDGSRAPVPAFAADPVVEGTIYEHDVVFTNSASWVYAHTGRPAAMVPLAVDPATGLPNPDFDRSMRELRTILAEHDGIVVVSHIAELWDSTVPSSSELIRRLDLVPISDSPQAVVYRTRT